MKIKEKMKNENLLSQQCDRLDTQSHKKKSLNNNCCIWQCMCNSFYCFQLQIKSSKFQLFSHLFWIISGSHCTLQELLHGSNNEQNNKVFIILFLMFYHGNELEKGHGGCSWCASKSLWHTLHIWTCSYYDL